MVCGEYELTDPVKITYRHVKDWPIEKCNGVFGFAKRDAPYVLRWAEKMNEYTQKFCK